MDAILMEKRDVIIGCSGSACFLLPLDMLICQVEKHNTVLLLVLLHRSPQNVPYFQFWLCVFLSEWG